MNKITTYVWRGLFKNSLQHCRTVAWHTFQSNHSGARESASATSNITRDINGNERFLDGATAMPSQPMQCVCLCVLHSIHVHVHALYMLGQTFYVLMYDNMFVTYRIYISKWMFCCIRYGSERRQFTGHSISCWHAAQPAVQSFNLLYYTSTVYCMYPWVHLVKWRAHASANWYVRSVIEMCHSPRVKTLEMLLRDKRDALVYQQITDGWIITIRICIALHFVCAFSFHMLCLAGYNGYIVLLSVLEQTHTVGCT